MKRNIRILFLLPILLFFGTTVSRAQAPICPPNSDFEVGDYSIWNYYVGSCCSASGVLQIPLATTTPPTTYIPCSFALTGLAPGGSVAITGVDPWGGFPVVGSGVYSLRIGSPRTLKWAEKATYYVHVPSTTTNYSLIYRYAVVLEDPGHTAAQQPRFTVQAIDSATNSILPCANFNYVAGSLPGFVGPVGNAYAAVPAGCTNTRSGAINGVQNDVYYKPWATTSINLSAYGGHTIIMSFAAGDCEPGGHFGYGYIDMTCGTFAINTIGCGDTVATVSAPSGFANYAWYDSLTFNTLYGTTQTVTFPMPVVPTTYAVIMSPYVGFGCPDTLYTHIQPSNLRLHKGPDTTVCYGQIATLNTGATDIALPLSYYWSPPATLNCATCANPIATGVAGANVYTFTVTDAAGCNLTDSIKVTVDSVALTVTTTPTSCFGYTDGTAAATPTSGVGPYVYSWSTVPVQNTATATGLAIGTYSVAVTDHNSCSNGASGIVAQPPPLTMSIGGTTNPSKCDSTDGTIILNGLTATTLYNVRYLFTATATTTTTVVTGSYTSNATGSLIITGLPGVGMAKGSYDSITIVTSGCPYNELGPVVLVDPPNPALPYVSSNTPVCFGKDLDLSTTDVTPGVTYSWGGPAGFTSTSQTPTVTPTHFYDSGYYVVTVMVNNCLSKDSTKVVIHPNPHPMASNNSPICSGDTLKLTAGVPAGETADGWLWSGPAVYTSNLQNPHILHADSTTAAGTYTVTAYLNGCDSSNVTTVTIRETPGAPAVLDTNYCQYTDPVPPISAAGDSIVWFYSATGGVGFSTAPTPSTTVVGTTTWYATQTYLGCHSQREALTVGVFAFPSPQFNVSDSVYCQGTYYTFLVANANTGADYQGVTWSFGGGDSIQNINPIVHTFNAVETATVTANVYYHVCPDTVFSHNVTIFPYPPLHLGADTSICPGGEALTVADVENIPPATWQWSTGETTSKINIVAPGIYYCKVTVNGCATTDTINVANDCYMNIPNVFTPNGDGVNDYFYPRQFLTKGLTTFSMNIYNRWGQLVFTSTTTDGRGWDGSFNGVPQPEGVFVYIIDATFKDGQKEHHQGNVTLLR